MKIYVASSTENIPAVKRIVEVLKAFGHHITCEWYADELRNPDGKLKDMSVEALRKMAEAEIRGVKECDVLVALMPGGRGTHFEMGIAHGLGKPIIIYDPEYTLLGSTTTFHHLRDWQVIWGKEDSLIATIDLCFHIGRNGGMTPTDWKRIWHELKNLLTQKLGETQDELLQQELTALLDEMNAMEQE